MILAARHLLLSAAEPVLEDAAVRVLRGQVVEVLASGGARAAREGGGLDLGDGLLAPGFVNAHAHLELGGLVGRMPSDRGFHGWIGALLGARSELGQDDFRRAVRRGAPRLLATGTTAVGDIDSTGATEAVAAELGLRVVVQREVLDAWDPTRTPAALARVSRALPGSVRVREGLSPHAPYTVSSRLLAGAARRVERRGLPLAVHWAETEAEGQWLEEGAGPLAAILPASPRRSGLDLLAEHGLLGPRTALVHGNHPAAGEPERLARHGVSLVHCPGTHRFFSRAPFPLEAYRRAGVSLALGTDSLASNEDLDLRREMALARETLGLAPRDALELGLRGGARALGWDGLGALGEGSPADLVLHRLEASDAEERLDELTAGGGKVERVWVHGREVELAAG